MATFCAAQQARKRACGLLVLAALLVSSMAQDASSDTVRVKTVFEGIPQDEFDTKYNTATLQTVASAAGVPEDYVYRIGGPSSSSSSSSNTTTPSLLVGSTIKATTSSSGEQAEPTATEIVASSNGVVATEQVAADASPLFTASSNQVVPQTATETTGTPSTSGRRLSQVRAIAEYGIKTNRTAGDWASPEAIRRKVLSSAAGFGQSSSQGFGKGFYATLANNGVKAEPMVFLDNTQILAGGLTTDAPKSRFGSRETADIKVLDHSEVKAALNPNASKDQAKEVTLVDAPKSAEVPTQQQPVLQPWAIALIAVGSFLVVAAGSVFVWRKCASDGMRKSGSRQQFLPSTVGDTSA